MFSSNNSRIIAWVIWIIASVFYAYQWVLRVMPNIMLNDIMQRFSIDAATFGQLSGVYYIGYVLMHLPIGILLDRVGPKKVMAASILLTVIGLSPLIFADHWIYPMAGRFLVGMGSSAAILGVFKIIRMTFSEKRFPRMLSFSVTIGLIGAIYGGGPVSYLCENLGPQAVVQIFALMGIGLAAVTFWIVPTTKTPGWTAVLSDVKEVLNNRRVLGSCICAGLMLGPLEGFADVWSATFLKQAYGLEATVAASISSMIFIGMCFGSPVLSLIADKVGSYLLTIIGAGIVMACSFILFLSYPLSSTWLSLSFVLVGVCCAYQILAIYKASTYVREEVAGLTTAVANMIIMSFGYAFHTAMGSVIHVFGGPESSRALFFGVAVVPAALCLGVAGYFYLFVREKKMAQA